MIPKFRCFDKDTKTMHEVVAIDFKDWRVYYEAYGLRNYWNKNVVLMQSTGLHDNTKFEDLSVEEQEDWLDSGKTADDWQGRKIFQGDIVKPERASSFVVDKFIFGEGIFKIAIITKDGNGFDGIYDGSSIKVIGNVHENPGLLDENLKGRYRK